MEQTDIAGVVRHEAAAGPRSMTLPIANGSTRLLAIIGDPIAQVRAPAVWSALFRSRGHNAVCVPMHWSAGDLAAALAGLHSLRNLDGVIVTIPHKPAASLLAHALTRRARLVGAANILRREAGGWLGDIADGMGFTAALAANGQRVAGRTALVAGAGGVGAAIAFALAEAGAASLTVADIDGARAHALVARLRQAGVAASAGPPRAAGYGLAVNASPVGMSPGDPLPIDPDGMGPETVAGEVVMSPAVTPWMEAASARGCFVQPGADLMDHEIAEMAAFFGFEGSWDAAAVRQAAG